MYPPVVTSWPAPPASPDSGEPGVPVRVMLLGVRVTAYAVINMAEHRRREAPGLGAVINPGLLDRLMDLPTGIPVPDPVVWAEMAEQPREVAERDEDGVRLTRRLESPLTITDVVVDAAAGRELRAVQNASLFAGFARRWIAAATSRMTDAAMLEAKLCGVGIVDEHCGRLLAAEKPQGLTRDGWSWLLEEKTYRRWLTWQAGNGGKETRARASGGASNAEAG
jgi:hypothetical protein